MARRDARKIRARIQDRQHRLCQGTTPRARHPRQSLDVVSSPDRIGRLDQVRGAVADACATSFRFAPAIPESSTSLSSTKRTMSPRLVRRTMRWKVSARRLIRKIAPHFQHRLFLTATPHNGYTESFTSLLELARRPAVLAQHSAGRQATLAGHDQEAENRSRRQGRQAALSQAQLLQALSVPFTADERAIHKLLDAYCKSREKTCRERGRDGHQVRQQPSEEAALLVAGGIRVDAGKAFHAR